MHTSRQAVPVVPDAVRPGYCSQQTSQSKGFAHPSSKPSRGSKAPSTFFVLRYQNSLLFGRCGCRHYAVITPSHIGWSHHPILPTSNFFCLSPCRQRHRHRHRHRKSALLLSCPLSFAVPRVPGLPRLQRWTVIFLRSNRKPAPACVSLPIPTLISTVRPSSSLIFAAHLS
jgi:hypothetical protein